MRHHAGLRLITLAETGYIARIAESISMPKKQKGQKMAEINIEKMAQIVAEKAIQELRDNGVLEQEPILDKVRAEIVELTKCPYSTECLGANCPSNTDCMICGEHVLEIIDKYKAESEGQAASV